MSASELEASLQKFEFSDEMAQTIANRMAFINKATLICTQSIESYRKMEDKIDPVMHELSTIVSLQHAVLEEKFKLLFELVQDVYTKLDFLKETK